jgi:hypothetical protein
MSCRIPVRHLKLLRMSCWAVLTRHIRICKDFTLFSLKIRLVAVILYWILIFRKWTVHVYCCCSVRTCSRAWGSSWGPPSRSTATSNGCRPGGTYSSSEHLSQRRGSSPTGRCLATWRKMASLWTSGATGALFK